MEQRMRQCAQVLEILGTVPHRREQFTPIRPESPAPAAPSRTALPERLFPAVEMIKKEGQTDDDGEHNLQNQQHGGL
jgi:hypothetical protein